MKYLHADPSMSTKGLVGQVWFIKIMGLQLCVGSHIAVYVCVTSWSPVNKQPIKLHVSPCKGSTHHEEPRLKIS